MQFALRLAGYLGLTLDELCDRMSIDEFLLWQAQSQIEPFGDEWRQTSYICTMIGNAAGGKKGGKPFKPEEFLPARKRRQTAQEMLTIMRLIAQQQAAMKEHKERQNGVRAATEH